MSPRPSGDVALAFASFFAGLTALWRVAPHAVRAEIYSLGARHRGEPLAGAQAELKAPNLTPGRARLLRAAMAKGQKKSNREVRKPKAEKPKPAPAGPSFLSPLPKKK
jgi:hypothetical protein